jgi:NADPH:quinone reductase-like Zn-dependent oxidoreductase
MKMTGNLCTAGAIAGMDFAGVVLAVGLNVKAV